jgi:hypothetical protein
MRKQRRRSVGSWVEVEGSELNDYGSKVRRVCTSCGRETYLTVSPPMWAGDVFNTGCLERSLGAIDKCDGTTITVRESWRLLKREANNGKSV